MSQVTFGYCFVNSSESLKGMSKPVSKEAFRTTGSVPQVGPTVVATGVSVLAGAAVAAGAIVAGASVAAVGALVLLAGVPQAERSRDVSTKRLTKDQRTDFLFISLSPLYA
jgi:predicted phage tail protein